MKELLFFQKEASPLRKLLMLKAVAGGIPLSEYTATGNPLSFDTNVAKPLSSLLIPWTPTQSGSGDPSPENVRPISGVSAVNVWRTGKNIWDEEWVVGRVQSDGSIDETATTRRTTSFIPISPNTTYIQVSPSSAYSGRYAYYDKNKNFVYYEQSGISSPGTFTSRSDAYYIRITFGSSYGTTYNNDISINYPSTDIEYHAYTGQTYPVTFPALGKNLFDKNATNTDNGYANNSYLLNTGAVNGSQDWQISEYIEVNPNTAYTLSGIRGANPSWCFYDANKAFIDGEKYNNASYLSTITSSDTRYIRLSVPKNKIDELQLEQGSSATAYEPYTNTVYGGSLDVTTGVLTVTHKSITFVGAESEAWDREPNRFIIRIIDSNYTKSVRAPVLSNMGVFKNSGSSEYTVFMYGYNDKTFFYYYAPTDITDVASYKTWLATNNLQVVYDLFEPYTIQLTPTEVASLLGDNVIWSDTNGSNTAVYLKKG